MIGLSLWQQTQGGICIPLRSAGPLVLTRLYFAQNTPAVVKTQQSTSEQIFAVRSHASHISAPIINNKTQRLDPNSTLRNRSVCSNIQQIKLTDGFRFNRKYIIQLQEILTASKNKWEHDGKW